MLGAGTTDAQALRPTIWLQVLVLTPPRRHVHAEQRPFPRKAAMEEFNEDTGQTPLMGCRTQPDKGTHTADLFTQGQSFLSLYPFIFPTFVPPQTALIPAFGSSPKRLTTPHAQPLHPMPPPTCKGSQPPTDVCRQGSPLAHGAMAPPDSSRKAGAHFWEGVIGAPPPASISVLLCVHACRDKPSQVGRSPVMGLVVAGSGHHPGSPPTVVPLCSSVRAGADRPLNHITSCAPLLWAFYITAHGGR